MNSTQKRAVVDRQGDLVLLLNQIEPAIRQAKRLGFDDLEVDLIKLVDKIEAKIDALKVDLEK